MVWFYAMQFQYFGSSFGGTLFYFCVGIICVGLHFVFGTKLEKNAHSSEY